MKQYKVLIPCRDDKSGKSWKAGDKLDANDLPASVIAAFLSNDPPVLAAVEEEPAKKPAAKAKEGD
jgi:hypothetical protein